MSAVIDALAADPGCTVLRRAELAAFAAGHPRALLLLTGDVATRPEGIDVAVVVRELLARHRGQLVVGLVDRRDEAAVAPDYGVVVLPAVVYLRDGAAAEVVARMRDWPVYLQACERLLAPAGTAPTGGHA
ncbi:MAG: hypothetical protein U1F08_10280 [Steroidobacteraceae bacterium]